jgi:hypothetical protein
MVYDFEDNGLVVAEKDVIIYKGEIVLKLRFDKPLVYRVNGLTFGGKNSKFGVINFQGKIFLQL